ncbi:MAG: hypothetical protein IT462_13905 [Planctomycetes bacterium]|nr:hypothetical protein [Planctomycetota bacterium]
MSIQRRSLQSENSSMVQYSGLEAALARRQELLNDALAGRGKIVQVQCRGKSADIMALRWIYPGGVMPVVMTAANTTAQLAHIVACVGLGVPVFVIDEEDDNYLKLLGESRPLVLAQPSDPRRKPLDTTRPPGADRPQGLDRWIKGQAEELAYYEFDEGPAPKADWLVISYGACAKAARDAVKAAREKELTVQHLVLQTLFPLPERKIAALAMGRRFIVVPEVGAPQLHGEIQRIVPNLPVVSCSGSGDDVLATLMKFPRCC